MSSSNASITRMPVVVSFRYRCLAMRNTRYVSTIRTPRSNRWAGGSAIVCRVERWPSCWVTKPCRRPCACARPRARPPLPDNPWQVEARISREKLDFVPHPFENIAALRGVPAEDCTIVEFVLDLTFGGAHADAAVRRDRTAGRPLLVAERARGPAVAQRGGRGGARGRDHPQRRHLPGGRPVPAAIRQRRDRRQPALRQHGVAHRGVRLPGPAGGALRRRRPAPH